VNIDQARRILDFWLGIEYLQPSSPPKVDAKERCWNIASDQELPWNNLDKQRALPVDEKSIWRFTAYGGLLDMARMTIDLRRMLGVDESTDEDFRAGDPSAVVSIGLDVNGRVVGDVCLASLPWAMGRIGSTADGSLDFEGFEGEEGFEALVRQGVLDLLITRQVIAPDLAEVLDLDPEKVSCRPLTCSDMRLVVEHVLSAAGWSPAGGLLTDLQIKAFFVRRKAVVSDQNAGSDMLNSFLASDVRRVRDAVSRRDYGKGLELYLFGSNAERTDVVRDGGRQAVASTMPKFMPLGRWPSKFPLALAQQFSVNAIVNGLQDTAGLYSVNGPPGTGKTTLLRDVIAGLVVDRARIMASYDDPTTAFTRKFSVRDSKFPAYCLDEKICGYGMVVASANNGAVENVTKELPAAKSIDADDVTIDYFASVAESILAEDGARRREPGSNWGTIAAVLGNKDRRNAFTQKFWFTKAPEQGEERPDDFVSFKTAMEDLAGSGLSWAGARKAFLAATKATEAAINHQQAVAERIAEVGSRSQKNVLLRQEIAALTGDHPHAAQEARDAEAGLVRAIKLADEAATRYTARRALVDAEKALSHAREYADNESETTHLEEIKRLTRTLDCLDVEIKAAERTLAILHASAPSFFQRLFRPTSTRGWAQSCLTAARQIDDLMRQALLARNAKHDAEAGVARVRDQQRRLVVARDAYEQARDRAVQAAVAEQTIGDAKQAFSKANEERDEASRRRDARRAALESNENRTASLMAEVANNAEIIRRLSDVLMDAGITTKDITNWSLLDMAEDDRQKAAPWFSPQLYKLRHELFVAALDLHKAFILENKRYFKSNLSHFVDLLSNKLPPAAFTEGVRPLWETLFLVVPVVSTTFASFSRLFVGMGRESLGWLLIDEAGQATPQAAVGAIWRARRTVVVGDPIQIEPVVPLPSAAIEALRIRCNIASLWHPLHDSCQVLADRANRFGTTINDQWVGSPLRVHRRCLNPMFSVANRIAYENMMVYGTASGGAGSAGGPLGESCWFNVPAENAEGHWIPNQGAVAINLVRQILAANGGEAISPDGKARVFIISPFRKVAAEIRRELYPVVGGLNGKIAGTVHTFQGKEADTVILLLGGNPKTPGSISSYAAAKPNLLNVALTRAKERICVVGDLHQWRRHKYFDELADALPVRETHGSGRLTLGSPR